MMTICNEAQESCCRWCIYCFYNVVYSNPKYQNYVDFSSCLTITVSVRNGKFCVVLHFHVKKKVNKNKLA